MPKSSRLLPERFHTLARDAIAFGAVGLINTILDFAIYNTLLGLGALRANVFSTLIATTSSYLMNRAWNYRGRAKAAFGREYGLFFSLSVVGFGIQEAVLLLTRYGLDLQADQRMALNLAKFLGVAVAMVFRFWSYRRFVFTTPDVVFATPDLSGFEAEFRLPLAYAGER